MSRSPSPYPSPSRIRLLRAVAVALLALAFLAIARPAPSQDLTARLSVTGSPQHVVRTQNGGAEWLMSGYTVLETARRMPGAAVAFKSGAEMFGYRWDTQVHDPTNGTYGWFAHWANDARTWAETLDEEMRAAENAGWLAVYCQPTPKKLEAVRSAHTSGYAYQTDAWYANMVQYIMGRADSDYAARVAAMPNHDATDPRNANVNWANLRAARGHVAPYPIFGFCVGTEPYWVEDLSAPEYAAKYVSRARAIRAKVPEAKLGLFIGASGDDPGKWDGELIREGRITPDMVDFLILRDNYHGMGNPRDNWPTFYLGAYNARYANPTGPQFNADGTMHLWSGYRIPSTTNHYAEHARQWIDRHLPHKQELKKRLVWTEWGYCLSCSPGQYNDLGTAIMRVGQMADGLKEDILLNATWTINNEPPWDFGIMSRRGDSWDFQVTPSHYAIEMLHELRGTRYVPTSVTSPTYQVDPATAFPLLEINYLDAWMFEKDGDRFLFVINRHMSQNVRLELTNLSGFTVSSWKQLGGVGFTDRSGNKTNADNVVPRSRPAGPLVFEPVSISLVRLSSNGSPAPTGRIWGDVTRDGSVNSTDALGTLAQTVGLPNAAYDYSVADVNADGTITTLDALIDLYYSVGLDVSGYRVGQPVGGANGERIAAPQLARAPRPSEARIYVGLRQPRRAGRLDALDNPGDLRVRVRAARHLVEDEIGSFHLRISWDPSKLRYRSAGPPDAETQLLLGVNDTEAGSGSLLVAGASGSAFDDELLELVFERLDSTVGEGAVALEVIGLGAARSGEDLTPHVEVRAERVDPDGESGGGGAADEGLGLPYPNPAPGRLSIPVHLDGGGAASLSGTGVAPEVQLTVLDIRGRVVRHLLRAQPVGQDRLVEWDGTDETGRRVPAGIYIVQLRVGETRETRKVVMY